MAAGSELASAWVTIYPKFSKNFNATITKQISSAVGGATSGAARGVTSKGVQIGRQLGSGIKSGLSASKVAIGNVIASGITSAVSAAMSTVNSTINDGISRVDTLNNFPQMMEAWGESADHARSTIEDLIDGVEGLPTTSDSIVRATQRMYTTMNDLDKAKDTALGLNDMLLANGADDTLYTNALEQFSQMLAAGRVDMMAWRSVVNAAPKAVDSLAKSLLGASANATDLYNALPGSQGYAKSKVKLSLEDLTDAIVRLDQEGFDGMASFSEQARSASKGIATSLKNIRTAIVKAEADIFDKLGRDRIAEILDSVKLQVKAFANWFTGSGVFQRIKGFIDNFDLSATLERVKRRIGSTISWIQGNIVPPVKRIVVQLKDVVDYIVGYFQAKRGVYEGVFLKLLNLAASGVEAITPRLKGVIDTMTGLLEHGIEFLTNKIDDGTFSRMLEHVEAFAKRVVTLAQTIWPYIKRIGASASQILAAVGTAIERNAYHFEGLFVRIVDFITYNLEEAVPIISDFVGKFIDKMGAAAAFINSKFDDGTIQDAVNTTWKLLQRVYEWIKQYIMPVAEGIWSHFKPVLDRIGEGLQNLSNGQDGGIGEMLGRGFQFAGRVISSVFDWIDSHWPDIEKLFSSIASIAAKAFDGLVDFVDKHGDDLWRFFDNLLEVAIKALEGISDLIDKHGDKIFAFFEGLVTIGGGVAGFASDNFDWLAPVLLGWFVAGKLVVPVLKGLYKGLTKLKGIGETGKWWKDILNKGEAAKAAEAIKVPEGAVEAATEEALSGIEGNLAKGSIAEGEKAAAEAAKAAGNTTSEAAKTMADSAAKVSDSATKAVNETAKVAQEAAASCDTIAQAGSEALANSEAATRTISQAITDMDAGLDSAITKSRDFTELVKNPTRLTGGAELPEAGVPRLEEFASLNKGGELGETMSGVARDAEALATSTAEAGEAGNALRTAAEGGEAALANAQVAVEGAAGASGETAAAVGDAAAAAGGLESSATKAAGSIAEMFASLRASVPVVETIASALGRVGKFIPFLGEALMAADFLSTPLQWASDWKAGEDDYNSKMEFIENALDSLYDYKDKYGQDEDTRRAIMWVEDAKRMMEQMDGSTGWADDSMSWDYLKSLLTDFHFDVTADGKRIAKMQATDAADANAALVLGSRRGYAGA